MERILVTGSGTLALNIAAQALLSPGDLLVTHAPTWPNLDAIQRLRGARVARVPLELQGGRWKLDLQRLFDACGPDTRAMLINSPANPTGWTLTDAEQREILDFCRRRGIWLVADEVYNRIIYERPYAPTFADKIGADDQRAHRQQLLQDLGDDRLASGLADDTGVALLERFEMLTEYTNSCTLAGDAAGRRLRH